MIAFAADLSPKPPASIEADTIRQKAAAAIEAALAKAGFDGAKVNINARLSKGFDNEEEAKTAHEELQVNVSHTASKTTPDTMKKALSDILRGFPLLAEAAQWDNTKTHLMKLKATLADLIGKGADLPQSYLEWQGLNPDIKVNHYDSSDHAIKVHDDLRDPSITIADITFGIAPDQGSQQKAIGESVEKNITARIKEIKEGIAANIIAAQKITDEAGQADIRAKVEALGVEAVRAAPTIVQDKDDARRESITIKFTPPATPELQALRDKLAKEPGYTPSKEELKTLEDSNVINNLDADQISDAVSNPILNSGPNAQEIVPIIASSKDMLAAISGSLTRLKATKPELAGEVDAVLHDDTFKSASYWRSDKKDEDKPKPTPDFRSTETGDMRFELLLKAGQPLASMAEIAATAPDTWVARANVPAPAAAQEGFVGKAIRYIGLGSSPAAVGASK